MGSSSAPEPVSPMQYMPLIDAQADANRVNTIGPYGSSLFVNNSALNDSSLNSSALNNVAVSSDLSPKGASISGRDTYIPAQDTYTPAPKMVNSRGGSFGAGTPFDDASLNAYDLIKAKTQSGLDNANQNLPGSSLVRDTSSLSTTGTGRLMDQYLDIYRLLGDKTQSGFDNTNPNLAGLDPGGVTQVNQLSPELQPLLGQQIDIAGSSPYGEGAVANQALLSRALNPEQTNKAVADATFAQTMDYLNPEFDKQSRAFEQKLANQGIQAGNEAYSGAYADMTGAQDRAKINAANQAVLAGQQAALSERGQNINELAQASNQGLQGNTVQSQLIAQLLGGNRPGEIQALDTSGPANMAMNQNMAAANNANANKNSQTNAATTLGAAYMMSDRRAKKDLIPVGKRNGFSVYFFNFNKWAIKLGAPKGLQFGVMADEVKEILPQAVITGPDGYDRVNYGMIL